jgi:hypothetical protein
VATETWICKVCWQRNRARDEVCWRCKSAPELEDANLDARRKEHEQALAARAQRAQAVPDALVAVPVVVFRSYAKAWQRGGIGLVGVLLLMAFGGVTDVLWLALTIGFAVGLFIIGIVSGEVAEGMRNRETWAYLAGIAISVAGGIGSVLAFDVFAPDLINPTALRWVSLFVFGGAAVAAIAGLVMLLRNRVGGQAST